MVALICLLFVCVCVSLARLRIRHNLFCAAIMNRNDNTRVLSCVSTGGVLVFVSVVVCRITTRRCNQGCSVWCFDWKSSCNGSMVNVIVAVVVYVVVMVVIVVVVQNELLLSYSYSSCTWRKLFTEIQNGATHRYDRKFWLWIRKCCYEWWFQSSKMITWYWWILSFFIKSNPPVSSDTPESTRRSIYWRGRRGGERKLWIRSILNSLYFWNDFPWLRGCNTYNHTTLAQWISVA